MGKSTSSSMQSFKGAYLKSRRTGGDNSEGQGIRICWVGKNRNINEGPEVKGSQHKFGLESKWLGSLEKRK